MNTTENHKSISQEGIMRKKQFKKVKITHIQTNPQIKIPNISKDLILRKSNQPSSYKLSPNEINFIKQSKSLK